MEEMEILLALHELDLWPIDHEITEKEVKEKWKALMVAFHPDKIKSGTFKDGEKAKKINNANDFILENLDAVNAFIRSKITKGDSSNSENDDFNYDDVMRQFEDLEEELKRYQEKLEEEERIKQKEQQRREAELRQREQERLEAELRERLAEEERSKEKLWNKIVKFSIMGCALIMMILTLILADNSVDTSGSELRAMSIFATLPIIILTVIPATRKKLFSLFVNIFFLFVVFIFFLASLGM